MSKPCDTHLSQTDRETLSLGLIYGQSLRIMAKVLGRAPSTMRREAILSGQDERLATTLEIVAAVIGKKIVEHAGRGYLRTATVSQRRSRLAPSWFFYGQHGG